MKTPLKFLGMTAAIALLSAPAMAHQTKKVDLDGDGYAEATVKYSDSKSAFHRMDANHDGRVTRAEFGANTMHDNEAAVFAMFDQDQNGYLTRSEVSGKQKQFAQPGNAGATTNLKTKSGRTVGSMDQKYYIDNPFYNDPELRNDVNIDIDNPFVDDPELENDVNWEWPRDLTFEQQIRTDRPLFAQLDDNNNGVISQAEFQANTIHNNEAAVFGMLDKNEDGVISRYELRTYSKTGGTRVNS